MQNDEPTIQQEEEKDKLNQLLDSSYPLLQQFRDACPGTFKHSQAISSMVESICMSLGLRTTFMKVAALYHDIGKTYNPKYFTENQLEDEDPHSTLEPKVSYQIISRHVSDTALILLNDENFPRELIEIVSQHHGRSVMKYFFDKSGSEVEDHYRYKTQRPKCIESAILMICDCIEAKTRSEIQSGKKALDPDTVIEDTINALLSDGQLDDVVMRLGDLQKIKEALAKELEGTYQKRVDYAKAKLEKQETKKLEEPQNKEG